METKKYTFTFLKMKSQLKRCSELSILYFESKENLVIFLIYGMYSKIIQGKNIAKIEGWKVYDIIPSSESHIYNMIEKFTEKFTLILDHVKGGYL